MSEHLTDDELIRHFYGDGPVEQEPEVDRHLRACAECRALWEDIAGTLKTLDRAAAPEPDGGFEERMWARVQPALGADGHWAARRRSRSWLGLGIAASLAAAIVTGVLATRMWPGSGGEDARPAVTALDSNGRERVLLTALDDHFQRSEMLLVELMNAPASPGAEFGFERATADDLVDSGRLYRAAAEQNGNFRLADMLEDLESVLVEVARSPDQIDRSEFYSLRTRIEDDDLLFKVRAVSQQIQDRRKDLLIQ